MALAIMCGWLFQRSWTIAVGSSCTLQIEWCGRVVVAVVCVISWLASEDGVATYGLTSPEQCLR